MCIRDSLYPIYDSLAEYESNREEYPCIDDYLQVLIPLYLEGR